MPQRSTVTSSRVDQQSTATALEREEWRLSTPLFRLRAFFMARTLLTWPILGSTTASSASPSCTIGRCCYMRQWEGKWHRLKVGMLLQAPYLGKVWAQKPVYIQSFEQVSSVVGDELIRHPQARPTISAGLQISAKRNHVHHMQTSNAGGVDLGALARCANGSCEQFELGIVHFVGVHRSGADGFVLAEWRRIKSSSSMDYPLLRCSPHDQNVRLSPSTHCAEQPALLALQDRCASGTAHR